MRFPLVAMLATYTIFSMDYSFSNLFINIYLWKQHSDFISIGWFQLCSFLFVFIGFLGGAYLIRIVGSRINFLCSSIVALSLYLYLSVIVIDNWRLIAFTGVLNGLYIGLFFAGMNFYSLWFSNRDNLSKIIGFQYIIGGLAQMVTPLAAGWIIHTQGYNRVFHVAIAVLILQTLISTAVPKIRIRHDFRRKGFIIPFSRPMKFVGLSAMAFGFFYAFVNMAVGIFIYLFLRDEWILGEWNVLFTLLSVVTYYLLGRRFMQSQREMIIVLGVLISTIATFILYLPYSAAFIIYNAVIAVSLPLMWAPVFTQQFNAIKQQVGRSDANPLTKTMELLVFREFALCLGRIAFFALLIGSFYWGSRHPIYFILFVISFMPACLYLFHERSKQL